MSLVWCFATLTIAPDREANVELLELIHCFPQDHPSLAVLDVGTDIRLVEWNSHFQRCASDAGFLECRGGVVVDAAEEENTYRAFDNGMKLPVPACGDKGLLRRRLEARDRETPQAREL